ncbi:MAG: ABC transporter permease [Candidatus Competibacteraceae bacterium]|nr:ABC transporter permease [Candidatus Competibacteraceae bacterium]
MSLQRFLAVLLNRNREFMRDRSSLAWNLLFPIMVVLGFAFAFSGGPLDLYKVGVHGGPAPKEGFFTTDYIDFIPVSDLESATVKVARHQLDMVVDLDSGRYWINDSAPNGYILERVLAGSGGENFAREAVSGQMIRYVDWVLPGVLGMNMMFSALFGVGYVIVRYRKNGMLKRLRATPLTALEFLAAQVVSRMMLILAVGIIIYLGTDWLVGFAMNGSYLTLLLVFLLGAVCLISLSLLLAGRTASEELAGGLLNMCSWPMMFLSGVWFSLEGTHPLVQKLAQLLPLTHVTTAARRVMIDGVGILEIWPHLLVLMVMTAVFLGIGARLFRWE